MAGLRRGLMAVETAVNFFGEPLGQLVVAQLGGIRACGWACRYK